ncbi:MAG: amidohydrolase family protein [Novosphingobium sp.]
MTQSADGIMTQPADGIMTQPADGPIVLDVHAHLVPVVEARLAGLDGVEWDAAARVMYVDGHAVTMKKLFEPDELLAWMDRNRVECAWVSTPPPLYRQHLSGTAARVWADYLNQGLAEIAAGTSGRIEALFHLPTQDPAVATQIASAAIAHGHKLFSMPTGTGDDRGLSDPAFDALWHVLNGAGSFVFLHPGECADGRLRAFYLSNLLGNPYESSVALAHLVFAGVPQRYPAMTLCFAHGGGLAPMAAGRWDRGHATARPGIDPSGPTAAQQLPGLHVDCICHSEPAAILAEATFGQDHVLFGSDWPFPMGLIEPHEQLQAFAAERRARYLTCNPRLLLRRLGVENTSGAA